jgi:hypothetical protein
LKAHGIISPEALAKIFESSSMTSCSSVNFERLARQDLNFLLMERMAGRITQFDVVASRAKRKLL